MEKIFLPGTYPCEQTVDFHSDGIGNPENPRFGNN